MEVYIENIRECLTLKRLVDMFSSSRFVKAEDTASMMGWVHTLREANPDKEVCFLFFVFIISDAV